MGAGDAVEKELGLRLFSQARFVHGNVSASEARLVNEVGGIFMWQTRLKRFNVGQVLGL